jgi:hypothetical protein
MLWRKRVAKLITFLFLPKFYRKKFIDKIAWPPFLSLINPFELCLSLKAGAKIETFHKTAKQKVKKYSRKFLTCSFQERSK